MGKGASAEQVVREIHRRTRRRFSVEEKVRIVLEGLRGEASVVELCRREGLAPNLYYRWSKEFLEAGKKRLLGDTAREATAPEVQGLRAENTRLKQAVSSSFPTSSSTSEEGVAGRSTRRAKLGSRWVRSGSHSTGGQ